MIMSLELLTIMILTHDYVELHMILTARHIYVFGSKHKFHYKSELWA